MKSPRLARWLLRAAASAADRDDVVTALDEESHQIALTGGEAAARRWYWNQTLRSLAPLFTRRLVHAFILIVGVCSMRDLRGDLLYAFRRTVRRPLLPLIVLATVGASVAAVTSVFSVADAVLFRPLPLPDSDRIVRFYSVLSGRGGAASINYLDLQDIRHASQTMSLVSAYTTDTVTWRSDASPESLAAVRVGPQYLDVLALHPQLGRDFDTSEFVAGASDVALITDRFWKRAFGARADVLDQVLDLDGHRVRVIGVLPQADFLFPAAAEIWLPLTIAPDSHLNNRQSVQLGAIGRVRPTRTVAEAALELGVLDSQLQKAYPDQSGRRSLLIRTMRDTLASPVQPTLLLLVAAVAAVLLIAGANVADFLLSDAASRRREFAIRSAIGAAGVRLTRQILVETVALVVTGGLLGCALAPLLTSTLISSYPTPLPRVPEIVFSARAVAVAISATIVAGLLAALPLIGAARGVDLTRGLREGGGTGTSRRGQRLASALVVVQVALSVILLSAGALLLRTFVTIAGSDVGFDPSHLLVFNVSAAEGRHPGPEGAVRFYDDLLASIAALPGVHAAAATQFLPLAPGMWGDSFARVGTPDAAPNLPEANLHMITPALPAALGLRVMSGRAFTPGDTIRSPKVVLVNETLARNSFGGAPVARQIVWGKDTWTIVGVLSDKRQSGVMDAPSPEMYFPWTQFPYPRYSGWVVVRADRPLDLVPEIKARLHDIDSTVPITKVGTMDDRMADVIGPQRFRATLAGALGLSAVLLATVGLYGILAHRVARQTREIGLRLALGEPAHRISRRVVGVALRLAAAGIVAGVLVSLWFAKAIEEFLTPGLHARDVPTLALVSIALLLVAVSAAWLPAVRASRTDPLVALRAE